MARVVRWTPVQSPFDRFFEDLYQSASDPRQDGVVAPPLDIIDADDHIEVRVNLPGIAPEHVNIEFDKGVLSIATPAPAEEDESVNFTRRERYHGALKRTLRVPDTLDTHNASAHFEYGVLYLTLPKKPEAQPVRIPITNSAKA